MKFFSDIRLLLLGIWLGAACFFVAVAQAAFAVLPQHEMAGAVVGRTLTILDFGGMGIAAFLIISSLVPGKTVSRFWLWIERFLLLLLAAACAVEEFVIGLWISMVRSQMGKPIDEVAADDPLRMQFYTLHQYSEWVLLAGMAAALVAFFIISNRKFGAAKSDKDVFDFSKEFKS